MRIGMGAIHHGMGQTPPPGSFIPATAADCGARGMAVEPFGNVYYCVPPYTSPPPQTCIPTDQAGNAHCQYVIPYAIPTPGVPICVGTFGTNCGIAMQPPPTPTPLPITPTPITTTPHPVVPPPIPPVTVIPTPITVPNTTVTPTPVAPAPGTLFGIAVPTFLTQESIANIPNWVLFAGGGLLLFAFLGRKH